jgi:hypothetical protein
MGFSYDDCVDLINALDVLIGAYGRESRTEKALFELYRPPDGDRYERAFSLMVRIGRGGAWKEEMHLDWKEWADLRNAMDVLLGVYSQELEDRLRNEYSRPEGGEFNRGPRHRRALRLIKRIDSRAGWLAWKELEAGR